MLAYLLQRLAASAVLLLVMSVLVFLGVYAIGNPVDLLISPEADQAETERVIAALGLDKPLWQQYLIFPVTPLTATAWRTSTASNQPQRRLRPVTVPNSWPRSPSFCPTSLSCSVGNGPEPTRVV